jgi:hypothetical protein
MHLGKTSIVTGRGHWSVKGFPLDHENKILGKAQGSSSPELHEFLPKEKVW